IARAGASPSNASSVSFTVSFSESVTGVDSSDFAVVQSGLTGSPSVSSVTGGPTVYTVTVSTGNGNGTLGLNLKSSGTGIADPAGNAISGGFTGQVYTIDKTPPAVTIDQASGQSDPTAATPINFTVVFSESVSDFATGDVTLSGTAGATTAAVTGSGTTYNVAVSGMTADGTVIAGVAGGAAHDAAGNGRSGERRAGDAGTYGGTAAT